MSTRLQEKPNGSEVPQTRRVRPNEIREFLDQIQENRPKRQAKFVPPNAKQRQAMERLKAEPTDDHLWEAIVCFSGYVFYTASGLPFTYRMKQNRSGARLTDELFIDRKANSKSVTRSTVMNAFHKVLKRQGEVIAGPKKIGQIFGISYLYAVFWYFGLIEVPEQVAWKLQGGE